MQISPTLPKLYHDGTWRRNHAEIILTADYTSEVSQCKFDMANITVSPKHVTLPNKKNEGNIISGLKQIENPLRVNIFMIQDIIEIVSLASLQAKLKARKSPLKEK